MEVFETEKFYIFVKQGKSLWWNRTTSEFQLKCGEISAFEIFLFVHKDPTRFQSSFSSLVHSQGGICHQSVILNVLGSRLAS